MIDKLFEQLEEFFNRSEKDRLFSNNTNATSPVWFYYVETSFIDGRPVDRVVKTNLEKNPFNKFVSEKTKQLKDSIKDKRLEMKKMAQVEKFEEAISLKKEISVLESELSESMKLDEIEHEKNKSASELLKELDIKLKSAVKNEEYEEAAKIRDQIKSLNIK